MLVLCYSVDSLTHLQAWAYDLWGTNLSDVSPWVVCMPLPQILPAPNYSF